MDTNIPPLPGPEPRPEPHPDAPGTAHGPRVSWDDVKDVRRLRRSRSERMVSGVAGGLARHLDVDPLLVRIGFGVLALLGGAGVVLYAGLWLLVPEDGEEQGIVTLDSRSRQFALVGVAALAALFLIGDWNSPDSAWPWIVVVAALGWFLYDGRSGGKERADAKVAAYQASAPTQVSLTKEQPQSQGQTPAQTPSWAAPGPYTVYGTAGPVGGPVARPVKQPDPRRRGPVLFWMVLALAAIGVGVLGTVDVAGADVPASAYPALVTGAAALGLLVGAFWGRAGGLIALGLVAAAATASMAGVEQFPRSDVRVAPTSAASLSDEHEFRAGEFVLDLTEVRDVEELAGREISLAGGVGRIEVLLPADLHFDLYAEVGVGSLDLDGELHEGLGLGSGTIGGPDDGQSARLVLDVELGVGEVVIRQLETRTDSASTLTPDDSILLEGNPS